MVTEDISLIKLQWVGLGAQLLQAKNIECGKIAWLQQPNSLIELNIVI